MRLIRQRDETGCGLACVAMLANTSYASVRSDEFGDDAMYAMTTQELIRVLRNYGMFPAKKLMPLGKKRLRELPGNAVLAVKQPHRRNWHWVVWDYARQRILDPQYGLVTTEWLAVEYDARPTSYMLVERPL